MPRGAHIRRINPCGSLEDTIADVKRHRIVRRGMRYGPNLPDGIGDDGVDRGAAFLIIGASIARQFKFLQQVWVNDGHFVGLGAEKDPLIGVNDGTGTFTIPAQAVAPAGEGAAAVGDHPGRRRLLHPRHPALQWIAEGQ